MNPPPPPARLYDRLGAGYDDAGLGAWAATLRPRLLALLARPPLPPPGRWGDLGCGTGLLASEPLPGCRQVLGLDASTGLLRLARGRGIGAVGGDVRAIPLADRSLALATATFDVTNHLLTTADLEAFFREVSRVLVPGGAFLFDANTPAHLRLWDGARPDGGGDGPARLERRGRFDDGRGTATVEFLSGGELLGMLVERAWHPGTVESLLRRAGLVPHPREAARRARGRVLRWLWRADRPA